jgi:hypothetical protein
MKQNDNTKVEGVSPMAFRPPVGSHAEDRTTPLVLPPKTSIGVFRQFMQCLEDIVGTENATIVSSDAELEHEDYMDPSKAHDVSVPPSIIKLHVVAADRQQMYHILPSNTLSAPRWLRLATYLKYKR